MYQNRDDLLDKCVRMDLGVLEVSDSENNGSQ